MPGLWYRRLMYCLAVESRVARPAGVPMVARPTGLTTVKKTYWALVEGRLQRKSGLCVDWLAQDERHRRMHVVEAQSPGAKEARLGYRKIEAFGGASLLEIELLTGRKHQIRLQMAHRGNPILGDRKYGSRRPWPAGIALHARRLVIAHPVSGEPLQLQSPLPDDWHKFGVAG